MGRQELPAFFKERLAASNPFTPLRPIYAIILRRPDLMGGTI